MGARRRARLGAGRTDRVIVTYLDSSAVARLCFEEGELEVVKLGMSGLAVSSVVAALEVPLAVRNRYHRGKIDAQKRDLLLSIAGQSLESMALIGLSGEVSQEALAVADGYLLRSLDAIHIGTAVVVSRQQQRRGNTLRFCTGDRRQGEAAVARLGESLVDLLPPL
jgi:predicted nucleic acid-binding protein